jgi:4-hydroxy-3-polyprenylbenzoate decarboxylase
MSGSDKGGSQKTVVVAICGASGAVYGLRLLKALLERDVRVFLMVSSAGKQVLAHEIGYSGETFIEFLAANGCDISEQSNLTVLGEHDFFTPPASGSFRHDGMVIAPCTMGTLAAIAGGTGGNLIHRAADVCLKEQRKLILVPRETPLNMIHMENMLRAAKAGATILPASPSFYTRPASLNDLVDTVIARILDHLDISHDLMKPWGSL